MPILYGAGNFGETFNLADAYSAAERINAVRAETADRARLTNLREREMALAEQESKQMAEAVNTYSEMVAFRNDEAYKTRLADQVKAADKEGRFASATPQQIYDMRMAGLQAHLGIQPEKPEYRTVGGTLLQVGEDGVTTLFTDPRYGAGGESTPKPQWRQIVGDDGLIYEHDPTTNETRPVLDPSGKPMKAPTKSTAANAMPLRKEFESQGSVKAYKEVLPLLVSARKAPDDGYGDLQLIYSAGKTLDPGSVVREGELALTIAAGSPLNRMLGITQFSVEKGGRLPAESRRQLLAMINERALAYRQAYDADYERFAQYARSQDIDPSEVVGRHAANAYRKDKPANPSSDNRTRRMEAPPEALEYLRKHPETRAAFIKKYGYSPNGR